MPINNKGKRMLKTLDGRENLPDPNYNTTRAIANLQRGIVEGYISNWTRVPSLFATDGEFVVEGRTMDAAMAIEVVAFREREMYGSNTKSITGNELW